MSERNPFLASVRCLYRAPPFDVIDDSHYRPAFDEGVRQQRAEIRAIIDNPQPASFANTLEALEQSGQLLARVTRVFSPWLAPIPILIFNHWMNNFPPNSPSWGMTSGLMRPCFSA